MARLLQRSMPVYCMPDVDDPALTEELRRGLMFHLAGFPITSKRQFETQIEIQFADLVDYKILFFKDKAYTE